MAKYITKAQLSQLYQAQLIDNDEYLRLLKEFAGIESRCGARMDGGYER